MHAAYTGIAGEYCAAYAGAEVFTGKPVLFLPCKQQWRQAIACFSW
jgi:hypothetical protein